MPGICGRRRPFSSSCADRSTTAGRQRKRPRRTQREAEASQTLFRAADSLTDGLAIFDADDRFVFYNRNYASHVAGCLRPGLVLGKTFEAWMREGLAVEPYCHSDMGEDFVARRLAMREQPHVASAYGRRPLDAHPRKPDARRRPRSC